MNQPIALNIGDKNLCKDNPPYIIAEIGSNFDQDINKAFKLIEVASNSGANAVKFQLFNSDILYPNKDGPYKIFKEIELNPKWLNNLKECAKNNNVHFLASAFDDSSFNCLEENKIIAHKIASSETTNLGYVHKVALTGKPIIISTGMCDFIDIEEALNVSIAANNHQICIMQCSSVYPTKIDEANLNVITSLQKRFNKIIGFSDHTQNNIAAITAVGLGARVFEKHITLDPKSKGPDHFYASNPDDFKEYIHSIKQAFLSLGSYDKNLLPQEKEMGRRNGIYLKRDIEEGEIITIDDFILKRPCLGLRERYLSMIIGKKFIKKLPANHVIQFEDILF